MDRVRRRIQSSGTVVELFRGYVADLRAAHPLPPRAAPLARLQHLHRRFRYLYSDTIVPSLFRQTQIFCRVNNIALITFQQFPLKCERGIRRIRVRFTSYYFRAEGSPKEGSIRKGL